MLMLAATSIVPQHPAQPPFQSGVKLTLSMLMLMLMLMLILLRADADAGSRRDNLSLRLRLRLSNLGLQCLWQCFSISITRQDATTTLILRQGALSGL